MITKAIILVSLVGVGLGISALWPSSARGDQPTMPTTEDPCPCNNPVCRPGCTAAIEQAPPAPAEVAWEPCPCADPVCRPLCVNAVELPEPAATEEPCPCDNPICRPVCTAEIAAAQQPDGPVTGEDPCPCDNPVCRPACRPGLADPVSLPAAVPAAPAALTVEPIAEQQPCPCDKPICRPGCLDPSRLPPPPPTA